tara:strand:+ start:27 stop:299 length:273 start_codon:yes stop_codon:yes gene_type:complete
MEVICLEDEAFLKLVDTVVKHIEEKDKINVNPWISQDDAKKLLNMKSKTSIGNLRDQNKIIFTQPGSKTFLYNYDSILKYLEDKSNKDLI